MPKLTLLLLLGIACLPLTHALADTPDEQLAAASALFEAKRYSEAAQKLDAFLAANPTHAKAGAAAFALGRCRTELKQYDKAIPAYQRAIATKDTAILTIAELGLGEAAINLHQYDKAAPALEVAVAGSLKPQQAAIAWLWLGQSDFELKKYEKAEEAYTQVIRQYRNADFADEAAYGIALSELRLERYDSARQRFHEFVDRYPKSENRPAAFLMLGQMDLADKRLPQARSDFENVLNNGQSAQDIKGQAEDGLIQTLLAQGDYNAAIPHLDSAVKRLPATDPEHFRAALSLGNCYYRQKQYDPAAVAYTEASRSTEPAVAGEGLYWAANVALAQNRPGDASLLFSKLVAKYPKHDLAARAQLKAGDALTASNQTSAALSAYRAVLDHYPQSPEAAEARKALSGLVDSVDDPVQLAAALKTAPPAERAKGTLRLARLYLTAKKSVDAMTALTEMLKLKPDTEVAAEGQYLLGIAYETQEKSAPAAAAYAEAVRLSANAPWIGDAQGRLAWLYLELKQPANAEKAATAALALKPEKAAEEQDRLALVQSQLDQQKWDAALDGCKTLLDNNPAPDTIATVLYTQAWVNEKRMKPEEALPIWERLAHDYPQNPNAAEALLHMGDARMKAEKYDEARELYAKLLSDFPKSSLASEARFKMGSALFNLDKPADAAQVFTVVADDKTAGDYIPESLYWAGVSLDKADKKAEAIQYLEKLVTLYPKHPRVANAKIRLAALKAVSGN